MTYNNAVKHVNALPPQHPGGIERMRTILSALGTPQKQIRCIHICGDAGKSSCASMLSSVLSQSGYTVGVYSLASTGEIRERIKLGDKPIPHADFADLAKIILSLSADHLGGDSLSTDEVVYLVALLYFVRSNCCTMICERSFAKNDPVTIEIPIVQIISTLDDSHPSSLYGEIIRRGAEETITSLQHKSVYAEISSACSDTGSRLTLPIYAELEVLKISLFKTVFTYRGTEYSIPGFSPCQLLNAITVIEAVQAIRRLGASITDEAVVKGLANADLSLKCHAIAIDPTVIVGTASSKMQLDALVASMAQVSHLVKGRIGIYASPEVVELCRDIPHKLASCQLECDDPISLPAFRSGHIWIAVNEVLSPIVKGVDKNHTMLFIGNNTYVIELAQMVRKVLENI